mgnify:CR=1 FL=1
MKTTHEIAWRARKILQESAVACPQYADKLHGMKIVVSSRMTRCAGKAFYWQNTIKLSLPYFADDKNFDEGLFNTVTHEAAHLIVGAVGRLGGPHGPQWRAVHRSMGGNGERCHEFELADGFSRRVKHEVTCSKCGGSLKLGTAQYRRHVQHVKVGGIGYIHRKCP